MLATEDLLREHLFGPRPSAEVIIASVAGHAVGQTVGSAQQTIGSAQEPVGFALFFPTYSTFVGKPGIWLEDLFVLPEHRRRGIGQALLREVAAIAVERDCGRLEWSVLDWNQPAINVYKKIGAIPMSDWTTQRLTGENLRRLAEKTDSKGE
jgi:GNAT superfamily N-acetyltransferase